MVAIWLLAICDRDDGSDGGNGDGDDGDVQLPPPEPGMLWVPGS
jgi:hypothetical protein